MRNLAHIEKITWLKPIEGADNIELAGVLGWQCIVKKDEFKIGDLCVYIEIDSVVDKKNPNFQFLEKKNWRIKTMKMRGVISQGILFPLSILPNRKKYVVGDDVTKILKIKKIEDEPIKTTHGSASQSKQLHKKLYKNPALKQLVKYKWFRNILARHLNHDKSQTYFPNWITKTDETRLQNMPNILDTCVDKPMIVTEKVDGTSTTFGLKKIGKKKYDFAICSRNRRLKTQSKDGVLDKSIYCEIAKKYDVYLILQQLLADYSATKVVLQGETIGEGIQGNKYDLKGIDFYGFNLVIDGKRIDSVTASNIAKELGIKWVPILDTQFHLLPTVEEMIAFADGKSKISDTLREGLVIRDYDNNVSFKCISNKFLLKHNL